MPENEAALSVYLRCADQWIVGITGPICMNLSAVESIINIMGLDINDRLDVTDKVIYISRKVLSKNMVDNA